LEPFDSFMELFQFINFIRIEKQCKDEIIIYTGYDKGENMYVERLIRNYHNIIIKWGRYIMNQ